MLSKRTIRIAGAAALGVAAVGLGGTALADREDPTSEVEAIAVDGMDIAATTGSPARGNQQVAALDLLEGILEQREGDVDDFSVGAVELDLGPDAWLLTAGPSEDFDGDGTPEDLLAELEGLVGQPVTAMVRLDDDGDDGDVYVLNDLTYRDSAGGPAPWLRAGTASAEAASPEAVADAAAAAVGDGARVDELDRETAGDVAWEAEVIAGDGTEYSVLLDVSGAVLDSRPDD
jgi:uncharacterized membrane protein YkoI